MKFLRGLLTFLISNVLFIMVICLSICFSVKDLVQHQLITEAFKQAIINESDESSNLNFNRVEELIDSDDINKIIDSAIIDFSSYIEGTSGGVSDETVDLIIDFCIQHRDDFSSIVGEEVNIDDLKSPEVRSELKDSLNNSLKEINIDKNSPVVTVISAYGTITSNSFKVDLLIVIAILVVLLGLVNWSIYKWMNPVGIVLITSGIVISLFYAASTILFKTVISSMNLSMNIDTKEFLIIGIVEVVVGILLLIVCAIINKIVDKNKSKSLNVDNKNVYEKELDVTNEEIVNNNIVENTNNVDSFNDQKVINDNFNENINSSEGLNNEEIINNNGTQNIESIDNSNNEEII